MKGTAPYEDRLAEADAPGFPAYLSLRERDARCDGCRAAGVCPVAWLGALDCPDLDDVLAQIEGKES